MPPANLCHRLFRRTHLAGPFVAGFFHLSIQCELVDAVKRNLQHLVDLKQLAINTLYYHKREHHCYVNRVTGIRISTDRGHEY